MTNDPTPTTIPGHPRAVPGDSVVHHGKTTRVYTQHAFTTLCVPPPPSEHEGGRKVHWEIRRHVHTFGFVSWVEYFLELVHVAVEIDVATVTIIHPHTIVSVCHKDLDSRWTQRQDFLTDHHKNCVSYGGACST